MDFDENDVMADRLGCAIMALLGSGLLYMAFYLVSRAG